MGVPGIDGFVGEPGPNGERGFTGGKGERGVPGPKGNQYDKQDIFIGIFLNTSSG